MQICMWHMLLILLVGCDASVGFVGASSEDKRSDKGERNSSDSEKDDSVDEPVMVGGAHLLCADVSGPELSGTQIGCALVDPNEGKKLSLSPFEANWQVLDQSDQVVSVVSEDAESGEPYHKVFIYGDESYLSHRASLRVTDDQGRHVEYGRGFDELDGSVDFSGGQGLVPSQFYSMGLITGVHELALEPCIVEEGQYNLSGDGGCASTGESIVEAYKYIEGFDLCRKGRLNQFNNSVQPVDYTVDFNGAQQMCILQGPDIGWFEASGGCFVVPVMGSNGVTTPFIVSRSSGMTRNTMAQMAWNYRCRNVIWPY